MGYFIVFVNLLVKEKNLKTFVLRLNLMVMAQFVDKVRFLIGMVSTDPSCWWIIISSFFVSIPYRYGIYMLVPTTEQKEDLFDLTVMFQFLIGMVSTSKFQWKELSLYLRD